MIGISLSLAAVLATLSAPPADQSATPAPVPKIAPSTLSAADTRDNRITLPGSGGVKISMPTFSAAPAPPASGTPAAKNADGLIEVPANTLGPGEALWQRNDRIDSELKLARAEAFLAERVSTLPLAENAWGWGGGGIGNVWNGGGWGWGGGGWGNVGVISTPRNWSSRSWTSTAPCGTPNPGTVIHSSAGLAQRQFAEAARPKITHIESARAEAVRQFGRVAAGAAGPGGTGVPPVSMRTGRQDTRASTPAQSSSRSQPATRKSGGRPRK